MFERLAGHTVAVQQKAQAAAEGRSEEPAKGKAKAHPTQPAAKPKATTDDEAEDAGDQESDQPEDQQPEQPVQKTDKPVLPEDEDSTPADEDESEEAGGGEDGGENDPEALAKEVKALRRDNFKSRDRNRELKAELETKDARIAELERQARDGSGTAVSDSLPAGFERARTAEDVVKLIDYWQAEQDWAEDHQQEGYTGTNAQTGEEFTRTPQQVRDYRRQCERILRKAEEARAVFAKRAERESKARETVARRYPSLLRADGPRAALMAEIEKETPEIKGSPARELLLARLTLARMVEDGTYEITKPAKPKVNGHQQKPIPQVRTSTPSSPPPARRQPAPRASSHESNDDWAMSLAAQSMALVGAAQS